jgi:photosystem II stability/assembly factor-like uncharacterized protein
VVWASGTHGTYLRTLDGGATWTVAQVAGAENLDFRDVEAFSEDEAYLLAAGPGDQSRIYKTTNGGKSWDLQFTNHEPKVSTIAWHLGPQQRHRSRRSRGR